MSKKHLAFYKKHNAEPDHAKQLEMIKEYMLTLSAEEFREFMLEPLTELTKEYKKGNFSEAEKEQLHQLAEEWVPRLQQMSSPAKVSAAQA